MAAFPAAKLGALLIKQVSKPIANTLKNYAKSSPFFRKYICMPPAQLYHWSEVKMKMWILNLGKPVNIPVLNEQQAIELGANLLGEGVLFTIAALILISEYQRSSAKEARKEAITKAEKLKLDQDLQELYFITQKQSTQINELLRQIYDLEGRVVQVPWKTKSKKSPSDDEPPESPPSPPFYPGGGNFHKSDNAPESEFDSAQTGDQHAGPSQEGEDIESPLQPLPDKKQTKATKKCNTSNSLIACAYDLVENELFSDGVRRTSIVNIGIDHLYNNVYRTPIRS